MYNVTVRTLCTGEEKSNIFLQRHLRRKKRINDREISTQGALKRSLQNKIQLFKSQLAPTPG